MDDQMKKTKLKSTAALVMHWSQELYQQKPLDRYLKYLDLMRENASLKGVMISVIGIKR